MYLYRHTPSGQSRVYRVRQLRIEGVHCQAFAGTGPVVKVVPVTGAAFAGHHGPNIVRLSFHTLLCNYLNPHNEALRPCPASHSKYSHWSLHTIENQRYFLRESLIRRDKGAILSRSFSIIPYSYYVISSLALPSLLPCCSLFSLLSSL